MVRSPVLLAGMGLIAGICGPFGPASWSIRVPVRTAARPTSQGSVIGIKPSGGNGRANPAWNKSTPSPSAGASFAGRSARAIAAAPGHDAAERRAANTAVNAAGRHGSAAAERCGSAVAGRHDSVAGQAPASGNPVDALQAYGTVHAGA